MYGLFDANWQLLYVGITENLAKRLGSHRRLQFWWPEVAHIFPVRRPRRA